jgi:lysophospholipase L1-like esterase
MRKTLYQRASQLTLCAIAILSATSVACSSSDSAGDATPSAGASGAPLTAGSGPVGDGGGGASAGAPPASAGSSAGGAGPGGTSAGGAANGGEPSAGAANGGTAGTAGSAANAGSAGSLGGSAGGAGAANLPAVSVYIAGDSTVSQYVLDPKDPKSWAGWGQMLSPYYSTKVTVVDAAVGGRTARRFIQEKSLDGILSKIKPGDYLLVQFGTNDSNTTSTYVLNGVTYPYYAAADTDFKTYLQQYIDGALAKQAIPVLVTPPPRNSAYCKGPRSLANYGQAMLDLGAAKSVAVVDLGLKTHAYLAAICPKPSTAAAEMFFKINADGTIDGTHFQENGARIMAGFVADGIGEAKLALAAYRKP